MKKYFLLMILMTVVFLGLGNSYASAQCEDKNISHASYLRTGHVFTCELNRSSNSKCAATWQTCVGSGNLCTNEGYACCICDPDPTNIPTSVVTPIETAETTPTNLDQRCKDNERLNTFGKCVCIDGYKEIDNVCVSCATEGVCCGIELNTSIPFIGNCIEDDKNSQGVGETNVTGETAFPVLMGSLTKILVSVILIISFVLIVIGGIMIATGDPSGGKKMIIKVVIGIALLGASGVILRLINPNFFG